MLDLIQITKIFNKGTLNEKTALDDVSLHLNDGDFTTIIGGNGAGKSTLLNAIAGSFTVDKGRIFLDGTDITFLQEHKRAKNIGRLFQDPLKGTAPNMTIEENMALAYGRGQKKSAGIGISKAQRDLFREKLSELNLGLEDRMKSKMGLLSGGQRQAVTLLM
ncbi:MAG: ATP-binding cassette domain-containing protein, partial [Clostridiales bacterium]|nr:ATP-binding cassette domain-containing protein [Clostridiales bacterium]